MNDHNPDSPEEIDRQLAEARQALQDFEDNVDRARLMLRLRTASPAHPLLLIRFVFGALSTLCVVFAIIVLVATLWSDSLARALAKFETVFPLPEQVPALPTVLLVIAMFLGVAWLTATLAAYSLGRDAPLLPWEQRQHQKLFNEVSRITTQKAVMERIKNTPAGARPRIATPVPAGNRRAIPSRTPAPSRTPSQVPAPTRLPPSPSGTPSGVQRALGPTTGGFGRSTHSDTASAKGAPIRTAGASNRTPVRPVANTGGFGARAAPRSPAGADPTASRTADRTERMPDRLPDRLPERAGTRPRAVERSAVEPAVFPRSAPEPDPDGSVTEPVVRGVVAGSITAVTSVDTPSSARTPVADRRQPVAEDTPAIAAEAEWEETGIVERSAFERPEPEERPSARTPVAAPRPSIVMPAATPPPVERTRKAEPEGAAVNGWAGGHGVRLGARRPPEPEPEDAQTLEDEPVVVADGILGKVRAGALGGVRSTPYGSAGRVRLPPPAATVRLGAEALGQNTRGGTPLGAPPKAGTAVGKGKPRTPTPIAPVERTATPRLAIARPQPEPPPPSVAFPSTPDPGERVQDRAAEAPSMFATPPPLVRGGEPQGAQPSLVSSDGDDLDAPTIVPSRMRTLPMLSLDAEPWMREAVARAEALLRSLPSQVTIALTPRDDVPFALQIGVGAPAMAVRAMVNFVEFLAAIPTPPKAVLSFHPGGDPSRGAMDRSFHKNVEAALEPYFRGTVQVVPSASEVELRFSAPDPRWAAWRRLPLGRDRG